MNWVPRCRFCGKTGATMSVGGKMTIKRPTTPPWMIGKCKLSPDKKHHCDWVPK